MKTMRPKTLTALALCAGAGLLPPAQAGAQQPDVPGKCGRWKGPTDASCEAGTFHPHPGHLGGEYRWTCRGVPFTDEVRQEDPCVVPMLGDGMDAAFFEDRVRRCDRRLADMRRMQDSFEDSIGGSRKCAYQRICDGLQHQTSAQSGTAEQTNLNRSFRDHCRDSERCHPATDSRAREYINALDDYNADCGLLVDPQ